MFAKNKQGVVINLNKSGLIQAKKRKQVMMAKEEKIQELENRLQALEELLKRDK